MARLVPLLALCALVPLSPARAETSERAVAVHGAQRSYAVHVPRAWDRRSALPVLLVFHGAGSDAESMMRATGFEARAETAPMIVVHPRAEARTRRYDVSPRPGRASADAAFVDAILADLRARFPLDERRIWATGFSNGAAFCYRLAAERPSLLAAIAPVAGYLPDLPRATAAEPVPVLHVHGTRDARVAAPPLEGGPTSAVARWAQRNGASRGPFLRTERVPSGPVLRRATYAGATRRADAHLLLVEGAAHEWTGGPGGLVTREILAFLNAHTRDDAAAPAVHRHPLVGQPFGSTAALRELPRGEPKWTLYRWWTNACPHCTGSIPALARLEDRHREHGLRMIAVYHPKGRSLTDAQARAYAARLGFRGAVAYDDRWTKYRELRDRGDLRRATSISVLVDPKGVIRWVHPGPRIEADSPDLAALDTLLARWLRPPAPSDAAALPHVGSGTSR